MMDIDIKGDIKNIERHLFKFQKVAIPKAANRAINRVIKTVQGEAARTIAKETGFKVKQVRDHLDLTKSTWRTLTGRIVAKRHSPNLIRYGAIQTKKGVKAKPYRKRRLYPNTFIANQGRTVFVRTSKKRLPIRPVYGPSVRGEFIRDYIRRVYIAKGAARWRIELNAAIQYYLSKI